MNMTNYISGIQSVCVVFLCGVFVCVSVFEHFTMENRSTFHTAIICI
jgi:hypothetical protein